VFFKFQCIDLSWQRPSQVWSITLQLNWWLNRLQFHETSKKVTQCWFHSVTHFYCCSFILCREAECQRDHLRPTVIVHHGCALYLSVKAAEGSGCSPFPCAISAGSHLQQSSCKHKVPSKESALSVDQQHSWADRKQEGEKKKPRHSEYITITIKILDFCLNILRLSWKPSSGCLTIYSSFNIHLFILFLFISTKNSIFDF